MMKGNLWAHWFYFVRLIDRVIPRKFIIIAEIIIDGPVGHQHHCDATVAGHERGPECTGITAVFRRSPFLCPEAVPVFKDRYAGGIQAAIIRIPLQGGCQQTWLQDLGAIHAAVLVVQQQGDLGDIVLSPEQTVTTEGGTTWAVICAQRG